MKIVAFIPIKLNNERTPGKNTKQFDDGTPLVYFVQKALVDLKEEGIIDEIYVYCSSPAIKEYLLDGIEFLQRPEFLDKKEVRGNQIYSEFVKTKDADIYVLAHATSPFVSKEHIRACVENVKSGGFDSAFCAKKIQNFLWQNDKPLNFQLDNPLRTQDMKPIFCELSTPYVFTRESYLRLNSRSGEHPYICECSEIEAIDIDYPEDFDFANLIYMNYLKKLYDNER